MSKVIKIIGMVSLFWSGVVFDSMMNKFTFYDLVYTMLYLAIGILYINYKPKPINHPK